MKIRYITCSDPREHNEISDIIKLGKMPNAEIAAQCHPSKMERGLPRNIWFTELLRAAYSIPTLNLAIHINNEWANDICVNGKIPNVLLEWLAARNTKRNPIIKRIQINMPAHTVQYIDEAKVSQIIKDFCRHEFIFQYNDNTKPAIQKIHDTGAKFSLLFDASGGRGVAPRVWEKPIYATHPMGYSGGISPDNVVDNLRKINLVVPSDAPIWIDAEGRLKSNDLFNEKMLFDTQLARLYVKRANDWTNQR